MKSIIKGIDYLFIIIFFALLCSSAFEEWFSKGNIILLSYIYFSIRIFYCLINRVKFTVSKISLFIVLFCLISTLWSVDSEITLKESVYLFLQTIIAIFIANQYRVKLVFNLLFLSGVFITFSSYIAVILFPEIGINQGMGAHHGLWEGVFSHKNGLSNSVVFFIIINSFLFFMVEKVKYRLSILIISFLQLILILKSGSTTALVLLFLLFISFILVQLYRNSKNLYLKASFTFNIAALSVLVIFVILTNLVLILNFFDKDLSFTGRDRVWQVALQLIQEKWFLGYGYKATFVENSDFYFQFINRVGDTLGSFHNGYFEVISYIGVLGTLFVLIAFIVYIARSIKILKVKKVIHYFPLVFLLYVAILNMTESSFLGTGNDLLWCIFVYVQVYLIKSNILISKEKHV